MNKINPDKAQVLIDGPKLQGLDSETLSVVQARKLAVPLTLLWVRPSSAEAAAVAYAKALKEAGAIADYEFGTLITRATEVRNTEMTVAALTAANVVFASVVAKDGIVAAEDGSITYTAAVINFTEDNMGTNLVARAYLKYTLIDGSALYVYAEDHTEGISIGELAQQCLADVVDESAEGYRNQVQEFYEADEDGWYELIEETAYSPYSKEQQAALKQIIENADL